jgi:hypothetical protein
MCHLQNLDTPATPFVTKALQLHPLPKGLSIAGRRLERVRPTA